MADPTTSNIGLIIPNTGADVGTWGSVALNPDFVAIDGFLGGFQTISVSSSNITLTSPAGFSATPGAGPTQSQNSVIRISGTPTTNIIITLPLPGPMIIENLTTGSFVVLFRAVGAGQLISIDQGSANHIYNDGINVRFVDLPPVGTYLDTFEGRVPLWISNCTVPPYLYCNGSSFSSGTYPILAAKLGSATLPDLRGRARYAFNDGTNRITSGISGLNGDAIGSGGGDQRTQLHNHNVTGSTGDDAPDHDHALNGGNGFTVGVGSVGNGNAQPGAAGPPANVSPITSGANVRHQHALNINSGNFGNGGAQNMPPAFISGITLIRAG